MGDAGDEAEHILPDDVARWPVAPHEVLGVPRDADAKAVKRAYAKLLRAFRPDDAPEAFARLQEAKESLLSRRTRGAQLPPEWFADSTSSGSVSFSQPGSTSASAIVQGYEQPDEVGRLWRAAFESDAAASLDQLRTLAATDARAALACEWLLRLRPELSPDLPAAELLRATESADATGAVIGRLRAVCFFTPEVLLDPRARGLLRGVLQWPDLVSHRWQTFVTHGRLADIEADLQSTQWVEEVERRELCRIALRRVGLLSGPEATRLRDQLLGELDDVASRDPGLEFELAAESRRLDDGTPPGPYRPLRQLLATLPVGDASDAHLRPILAKFWELPVESINRLELVERAAPMLVIALGQTLTERLDPDDITDEVMEAAYLSIRRDLLKVTSYRSAQTLVLRVCRSFLLPSGAIPWWRLQREAKGQYGDLLSTLSNDAALQAVTAGWCVWAFE